MGLIEDKAHRLRMIHLEMIGKNENAVTLTKEEKTRAEELLLNLVLTWEMGLNIMPYATQNVIEYATARFVAAVMKMHYDMFGHLDEVDHMVYLIRREWRELKDKEIYY